MFDRCFLWRRRLNRRAEGTLPHRQCAALEAHLAKCARCRAAAEADRALWEVMGVHTGLLDVAEAGLFDDRVVKTLRMEPRLRLERFRPGFLAGSLLGTAKAGTPRAQSGSQRDVYAFGLVFLTQLAGGAATAAAITALCLMPSLRPVSAARATHVRPMDDRTASTPPIPLELLLNTPAPRAALLWAAPRRLVAPPRRTETPAPAPHTPELHSRSDNRSLPPIG